VQSVLQPDEAVVYEAKLSWAMYIPGLMVVVVALLALGVTQAMAMADFWSYGIALVLLAVAAYLIAVEWFERWTTEIAITNKRIILKKGFIRRDTIEMSVEKVESVDVKQSLLGRLLDYGDIVVRGTGTGFAPMRKIDSPLQFRSHVTAS